MREEGRADPGGEGFHVGILDRGYRNRGVDVQFLQDHNKKNQWLGQILTRIMSGDDDEELFGEWVSLGGWRRKKVRARSLTFLCG